MASTQNKYGIACLTASVVLLLLSAVLLCACPIIPFLAGIFAVIASFLTNRMQRLISVFLATACFLAAYFTDQNQNKLRERAREAVRPTEEKSRMEAGTPVHESK